MHEKRELSWQVGHSSQLGLSPEKWVEANVPGAANLDWITANDLPDWKYETNFKLYKWTEDCYWVYKTNVEEINKDGHNLLLRGKGIDYKYQIYLNKECIYQYEGMYAPFCLDLTGKSGALEIWIDPVPKTPIGVPDTREEACQVCKPAVSYGWDWHPRLIPMGIWDDLDLYLEPECRFNDGEVVYYLADDYSTATVKAIATTTMMADVKLTITAPTGESISKEITEDIVIDNPLLWWCNGYGEPNLYSWKLECIKDGIVLDVKQGKVGFRKVKMEMNEGSWIEPQDFPKGRSVAPITIELNDVAIFAKGSNWVNPEVFVGTITKDIYEQQILIGKELNFNIFRCWGGAVINKDAFFELCDENGIMVWQEFMLACNNYIGTKEYLEVLENESTAVIKRLRKYTSVVMWCGGNELFNNWSGMTDQSLALRLLNKICYDLDPQRRPYLMTSPLFGMAHGCYLFCYPDGREVFQVMPASSNTAYTEFGVPSISNMDICMQIASEEKLFPMVPNDITITHHAFESWHAAHDTWCSVDTIHKYLGEQKDLQELIDNSQWLQGEGYKCIYEEARRQKPYCSMAINWCYNEPWPTLANNSLLNYKGVKKASCEDVQDACRPILASAQIPKFSWYQGEVFEAGLWLLNDSMENIKAGQVKVELHVDGEVYNLLTWKYDDSFANKNQIGPVVRFKLPESVKEKVAEEKQLNASIDTSHVKGKAQKMQLVLHAGDEENNEKYTSCYTLVYYK